MSAPLPRRSRRRPAKVLVTGPFDAGKTTLINTIADGGVITTERPVTSESPGSGSTTVAMDFGRLHLADDLALFLFGTPGQDRFAFMWDILADGMLGYLLVVDAARPGCLAEAERLRSHLDAAVDAPRVVVVNKVSGDAAAAVDAARTALHVGSEVPVLAADVRDRAEVRTVLLALLEQALARVTAVPAARGVDAPTITTGGQ